LPAADWSPRAGAWPCKASPASNALLDLRKSRRLIMVALVHLVLSGVGKSETIQDAFVMYKKKPDSHLSKRMRRRV
jgi:hypothetical protein